MLLGKKQDSKEQKGGDDRQGHLFKFHLSEGWKSCDKCSLISRGKTLFSDEANKSGEKLSFVPAGVSM